MLFPILVAAVLGGTEITPPLPTLPICDLATMAVCPQGPITWSCDKGWSLILVRYGESWRRECARPLKLDRANP